MKRIAATTLCSMTVQEIFVELDSGDFLVTLDQREIGVATKNQPEKKVKKVMTFSSFKRDEKKALSRFLKLGSVEVIATSRGSGQNLPESFFFRKPEKPKKK